MESVIKQLVKAGHDLAVQLGNQLGMKDTASLVQRLTAQLDNTAVALREMTKQRDALATENAGLKECTVNHAQAVEHWNSWADAEDKIPPVPETPATDSFMSEVRAQGVEQLAALAGDECQRYKSVNDRAGVRKWKSIVILCSDFATQLRKGGAA